MEATSLIIIGSIVSITSLIIAILKLANEKAISSQKVSIEQAILSEKLLNIEKQLVEIKSILCSSENKHKELDKRMSAMEMNCKIQMEKKTKKSKKED